MATKKLIESVCGFVVSTLSADGLALLGARSSVGSVLINSGPVYNYIYICGLCCQKQVSQAGISNYIPQ